MAVHQVELLEDGHLAHYGLFELFAINKQVAHCRRVDILVHVTMLDPVRSGRYLQRQKGKTRHQTKITLRQFRPDGAIVERFLLIVFIIGNISSCCQHQAGMQPMSAGLLRRRLLPVLSFLLPSHIHRFRRAIAASVRITLEI